MEGCGYRDLYSEFQALGVEVVGVSFDSPETNASFAAGEGFPYELWTDTSRDLALTYGAASSSSQSSASRVTVVLDESGQLLLTYDVGFEFGAHPAQVLEDCKALFGTR